MNFFNAAFEALKAVIKWIGMVYAGLGDMLGISETALIWLTFAIIGAFAGVFIYKWKR